MLRKSFYSLARVLIFSLVGLNGCGVKEMTPDTIAEAPQETAAALLFSQAMQAAEAGYPEQAIKGLKQVIALSPHLSAPHNNVGILYKRKGLLDPAIAAYQEAIRLRPDYAEAHNNLALAYREKGLLDAAERSYQEALRHRSDMAQAHYNLAVLYDLYLNEPSKAIDHYRRYLSLADSRQREVELWISILQRRLQGESQEESNESRQ